MVMNSTDHNYRRLISPSPATFSYALFSTPGYPQYGYIGSLTQSSNLNAPSGYVAADVIGSSRLIRSASGEIFAYGLSFSNTGFADSLVVYKSTDNGKTFTGIKKLMENLGTSIQYNPCKSIAFNGSTYSMVIEYGSYSNLMYSANAIDWTLGLSQSTEIRKVIWVPEKSKFYYQTLSPNWYTSTNGMSFSALTQSTSGFYPGGAGGTLDLIYCSGFGKFVSCKDVGNGSSESMYMSSDCQSWDIIPGVVQHQGGIQSLAYSPELNLVYGVAIKSTSGQSYPAEDIITNLSESKYLITNDTQQEYRSIAWLKRSQMFVITRGLRNVSGTYTPSKDLLVSKDGLTWTTIPNAYPAYTDTSLPSGWNTFNQAEWPCSNNILEIE